MEPPPRNKHCQQLFICLLPVINLKLTTLLTAIAIVFWVCYLVRPNYSYLNAIDSDCLCIKGTHILDITFFSSIILLRYIQNTLKITRLKYIVQWCFIYSELCNCYHNLIQNILTSPERDPIAIISHSQLPFLVLNSRKSLIYFLFMDFPILYSSHKWKHVVCECIMETCSTWCFVTGFFYLAYVSRFMLHHVSILHSILQPNNIPLCEYISYFTYSSADGHLFELFLLFGYC